MKVQCDFCQTEFDRKPSWVNKFEHQFCNKRCHKAWLQTTEGKRAAHKRASPSHRKIAISKQQLKHLYLDEQLSDRQIADKLGCHRVTVLKRRKEYNIPSRSRSHATALALPSRYQCNERFFEQWSPAMAWVLGLFFADGCVQENPYSAAIASKDKELLEQINFAWGADFPIRPHTGKNSYLKITGRSYVLSLMRHGLRPRKSLTMTFPYIPLPFLNHFVRGLFDGDGCYRINKKQKLEIWYTCGSLKFIQTLNESIAQHCPGVPKRNLYHQNNCYSFAIRAQSQTYSFCHWVYQDTDQTIRLRRKYETMKPFLTQAIVYPPK